MPDKFLDVPSRAFNPVMVPGVSEEARKAVNAALEAMSNWRAESVTSTEKNSKQVIEKMAAAARVLGWPEPIVDATKMQLQNVAKMQVEMMDHMMDAWEEQIKSPSNSSTLLSKLKSFPNFGGGAGSWGKEASLMGVFNPFQMYIQFVEQWQKACTDATAFWTKPGQRFQ